MSPKVTLEAKLSLDRVSARDVHGIAKGGAIQIIGGLCKGELSFSLVAICLRMPEAANYCLLWQQFRRCHRSVWLASMTQPCASSPVQEQLQTGRCTRSLVAGPDVRHGRIRCGSHRASHRPRMYSRSSMPKNQHEWDRIRSQVRGGQ